ncbi:class II histocompatibility antigen, B-L beta chain-like [Chiloscyllium punctatum]|uniref:class II histocompatibility antigen, B-L beta chain-like n=1 Tax=Chiloscyllium punctatum TaxID=137246 RepID=UPI003B635BE1
MGLCGIILLTLVTSVGAQIEYKTISERLYYSYSQEAETNGHIFDINAYPFLFYNYKEQTFVIHGQETDGLKELGEEEVTHFKDRAAGIQAWEQGITKEMIKLTNGSSVLKKKPLLHIYTEKDRGPGQSDILYCYAEKFYPFEIEVSFLINGRPFGGQVNSSQLVVEPDWTFNVLKYIRIEPRDGDTYSCRVNHISLQQPLTESLDPPPRRVHTGIIVCAVGVMVGALGFGIGLSLVIKIRSRSVHVGS